MQTRDPETPLDALNNSILAVARERVAMCVHGLRLGTGRCSLTQALLGTQRRVALSLADPLQMAPGRLIPWGSRLAAWEDRKA